MRLYFQTQGNPNVHTLFQQIVFKLLTLYPLMAYCKVGMVMYISFMMSLSRRALYQQKGRVCVHGDLCAWLKKVWSVLNRPFPSSTTQLGKTSSHFVGILLLMPKFAVYKGACCQRLLAVQSCRRRTNTKTSPHPSPAGN